MSHHLKISFYSNICALFVSLILPTHLTAQDALHNWLILSLYQSRQRTRHDQGWAGSPACFCARVYDAEAGEVDVRLHSQTKPEPCTITSILLRL